MLSFLLESRTLEIYQEKYNFEIGAREKIDFASGAKRTTGFIRLPYRVVLEVGANLASRLTTGIGTEERNICTEGEIG